MKKAPEDYSDLVEILAELFDEMDRNLLTNSMPCCAKQASTPMR